MAVVVGGSVVLAGAVIAAAGLMQDRPVVTSLPKDAFT